MSGGLPNALLLGALALLLVSAGIQDARTREIADWKNIAIAAIAPLWWWTNGWALWPDIAILLGVAAIVFALFVGAFYMNWMGGGDVKMIGALALWLPYDALLWMLAVMSLLGGALTLLLLIESKLLKKKEQPEIPYGVAIAIAALLTLREPILNHFL
jgi:prepilin peptidase CpaA